MVKSWWWFDIWINCARFPWGLSHGKTAASWFEFLLETTVLIFGLIVTPADFNHDTWENPSDLVIFQPCDRFFWECVCLWLNTDPWLYFHLFGDKQTRSPEGIWSTRDLYCTTYIDLIVYRWLLLILADIGLGAILGMIVLQSESPKFVVVLTNPPVDTFTINPSCNSCKPTCSHLSFRPRKEFMFLVLGRVRYSQELHPGIVRHYHQLLDE